MRRILRFFQVHAPVVTFVVIEVVAFALIIWFGRDRWFFNDDWDFLARREVGDLQSLLRPHYDHWVTIPAVAYRILWGIFGARHYLPYQLLVVFAHLGVAALLRVVMRRAGVGPWVATAVAGLFALFGAGYQDMWQAFQITFVGSVLFGLVHMLLADHDGAVDYRDWLGLVAGLAALMCSLVGLAMVAAVGLAVLLRRGWRVALLHTVPLGVIFLAWWFGIGDHREAGERSIGRTLTFVRIGVGSTFSALGQTRGATLVVAVVLVAGLWIAWGKLRGAELRRRAATSLALLAGSIVFLLITGWGRSVHGVGAATRFSVERAGDSRYLDVVAALILPAVAVAVDALVRRWRLLAPVLLVLVLIGVGGNIQVMADQHKAVGTLLTEYRRALVAVPRLPRAKRLPRAHQPESHYTMGVTIGWLLDQRRAGKLPAPDPPLTPTERNTELLVVAMVPVPPVFTPRDCTPLTEPVTRQFAPSDVILVKGRADVVYIPASGPESNPVPFGARLFPNDRPLVNTPVHLVAGPMVLRITASDPNVPTSLCTTRIGLSPKAEPDEL